MTAAWVAAYAAVAVAVVALAKPIRAIILRPIFWAFKQLIGTPVSTWAKTTIGEVVEAHLEPVIARLDGVQAIVTKELTRNGGTSMKDELSVLKEASAQTPGPVRVRRQSGGRTAAAPVKDPGGSAPRKG